MIADFLTFSLFVVVSILGGSDSVPVNRNKPEHGVQVKIDAPRWLPATVELADWTWQGDLIVSSERTAQENQIEVLQIGAESVTTTGRTFANGRYPVMLPGKRIAYLEGGRNLVVTTLSRADDEARRAPLGDIGSVGELILAGDQLLLYGLDTSHPDQLPTMVSFDPIANGISVIGKGYYPRSRDGRSVYFVSPTEGYSLMNDRLLPNGKLAGRPSLVSHGPVYFPQVVPGQRILVVQRGLDRRRVELISEDGKTLRTLSPSARNGTYPLVSPSGAFVAFATYPSDNEDSIFVDIVSLEGDILYSESSGTPWINSAFRWAVDGDRLAVVVRNANEERFLEIVTCSRDER
jgi:hypothetical protein